MKKMLTNLFNTYCGLFYSAQAYRGLVYQKWSVVLVFFVIMHFISGALATGTFTYRTFPLTIQNVQEILQITNDAIPKELTISWDSESKNLSFSELQYPIHLENTLFTDNALFTALQLDLLAKNTVTIDPTVLDTQAAQISHPNSFMIAAKNGLLFSSMQSDQIASVEYRELFNSTPSFTIASPEFFSKVTSNLEEINTSKIEYLPIFAVALIIFVVFFSISNLLLDTFFLILLVKLNTFSITIPQIIRLSLLIGSIASLMSQITNLLYPTINWPFYSITFWLIAMYVLLLNRKLW